mgnify:FL=1
MSENNKAILEQANAAIAQGNYEGFLSFCTDDTEWTFVGDRFINSNMACLTTTLASNSKSRLFLWLLRKSYW